MISMLHRKLLRDLWQIRSQVVAIALVMAAGIAMFVMSLTARSTLLRSKDSYYDRYRFADIFCHLKRAPQSVEARLAAISGISVVSTRIVAGVSLDIPGMPEPAQGRLLSIPDQGPAALNDLYLQQGRLPDPHRPDEILAGDAFCRAHQLQPGNEISAIINGKRQPLVIVGVVLSPEYVIQIQPGNLLPDDRRFGVFWMSRRQLAAAFNMEGAFNDVTFKRERGTNVAALIDAIDRILEPYGSAGAYDRSDQTSNHYLTDEITQLSTMAFLAPTIFLAVAAFLLNVVTSRTIGLQREQIAALKAFGYSNRAVGWHYLQFVVFMAMLGTLIGALGGIYLARNLIVMYGEIYHFPMFSVRWDPAIILGAISVSLTASTVGAWMAVRKAVRLPPAEAMRPEPPARFGPTLVERIGLGRWLPQVTRMILRQLERRPIKTSSAVIGIAMAVAVLILGSFTLDAVNYIMTFQFRWAQRQSLAVGLIEPTTPRVIYELANLPGVQQTQSFRSAAAEISHGHHWRRVGILGLNQDTDLFRILDPQRRPMTLPPQGIVLNDKLAELLEVKPGQRVSIAILEGQRPRRDVLVSGVIQEFGGLNAYMSQSGLNDLLGETEAISGAFLAVDQNLLPTLYRDLKNVPRIASVTIKGAALQSFRDTIAKNLLVMRTFNIMFSVVIAFGVVYNSARISLSEQSRDLATLRVMGFTKGEVSGILLGELAILTGLAIPVGCAIGYVLAALLIQGLDTEVYRIPLIIERSTYFFAALIVALSAIISGWIVQRRIQHLDLIAVLKSRE